MSARWTASTSTGGAFSEKGRSNRTHRSPYRPQPSDSNKNPAPHSGRRRATQLAEWAYRFPRPNRTAIEILGFFESRLSRLGSLLRGPVQRVRVSLRVHHSKGH